MVRTIDNSSKGSVKVFNTTGVYFVRAQDVGDPGEELTFDTKDSYIDIFLRQQCPIANPKQELIKIANSLVPYTNDKVKK